MEHPKPASIACLTASFEVNSIFLCTGKLFLMINCSISFRVAEPSSLYIKGSDSKALLDMGFLSK